MFRNIGKFCSKIKFNKSNIRLVNKTKLFSANNNLSFNNKNYFSKKVLFQPKFNTLLLNKSYSNKRLVKKNVHSSNKNNYNYNYYDYEFVSLKYPMLGGAILGAIGGGIFNRLNPKEDCLLCNIGTGILVGVVCGVFYPLVIIIGGINIVFWCISKVVDE